MGRRIRNLSAILLKCALVSFAASGQQAALGAGMAAPPRLADGVDKKPEMMVAAAEQAGDNGMATAQATKNADAPAEPQASVLEHKSTTRLPSRKLRRRKPQMAGVPAGPQAVAQVTKEPGPQAVAQETEKTGAPATGTPVKPQAVAQETEKTGAPGTGTPVKPQAVAQDEEETDALASSKPQAEVQEKPKLEQDGGKKYRMAPVRWGARVSETLAWLNKTSTTEFLNGPSSSIRSRTLAHVQTAEIKLSSYIMQPYIAQVSGGIGVVSSADRISGANNSRSNSLYGNGELSLFSRSRFPFNMAFGATNSRTNAELTADDTVGKTLSLQQSYSPASSYSSYTGRYSRSSSNSIRRGNTAISLLDGGYSTRLGSDHDQPFNVRAQRTVNTDSFNGSLLGTNILRADHTYMPRDSLLSLTTNANLTSTSQQYQGQSSNNAQFMQANTTANWQPESEDLPLFVTGSGQFFRALTTSGGGRTTATQSLGGTAGATYVASHNLSYNASGGVTHVSSGATSSLITSQIGKAMYRHDPVHLGGATYSWNANGGANNLTGPNPNRGVFGGVGHALGGPYALDLFGKKSVLRYGVNQTLGVVLDRLNGQRETLINSGNLSWAGPQSDTQSSGASVSMTDTRIMGKNPAHTQVIIFGLNGLGRYHTSAYGMTVDTDAVVVMTRDQNGNTKTTPAARGTVTYNKLRVFGVRGLQYNGLLNVNVSPNRDSVYSNLRNKPVSYSLIQRLSYRIGQNELLLAGSLSDQNGLKNALLLLQFRAWRTIGN